MVSTGSTTGKRALVVTVVHHPEDARIRHRQITALLEAGWQVTYAAPFTAYGVGVSTGLGVSAGLDHPQGLEVSTGLDQPGRLTTVDLPRALGRRRLRALRAARQLLAAQGPDHDVVLLHDPELVLAAHGLGLPPVVWDVHEDTAAAVSLKPWLPGPARRVAAGSVLRLERLAERHHHLLLAEDSYADRFPGGHPVVPNTTTVPETVPPPDDDRVVHVGHLTAARGVHELIALGRLLADRITVELIGHADTEAAAALAAGGGAVDWRGFLPYDEAMARVAGARAGLSLLHDQPNYRHSRPTKVIEYLAHGVPVVTTPLPVAARLATDTGAGIVVPFEGTARAAADAILGPLADPGQRLKMGFLGHHHAAEHYDWSTKKHDFCAELARFARRSAPS